MQVDLPQWAIYLIEAILLFIGLCSTAVVISRAGRNPYWAFIMMVPFVQILAIWYLAFSKWPAPLKKKAKKKKLPAHHSL